MPLPNNPPALLRLRILAWHARPVLGLLALLIACATVARLSAPPPPPTLPVVVAAHDVPSGTELIAADLRVVEVPRPLVPGGVDVEGEVLSQLIGRRVAVDVPRGLAVVEGLLEGARFGVAPPAGTVVVPVRLDAAVAGLLRPGDLIDLVVAQDLSWTDGLEPAVPGEAVAGDGSAEVRAAEVRAVEPRVLAGRALVLDLGADLGADHESDSGLAMPAPSVEGEHVVLVAVTPGEGGLLAAAAARAVLGAVLVG